MAIDKEIWADVPGHEGLYRISNMGRVRSCDRKRVQKAKNGSFATHSVKGRVLTIEVCRNGYSRIALTRDGKQKKYLVHRLVMAAFVGECPDGKVVCHWDGDRGNNNLNNLRYDTRSGNEKDKARHGRVYRAHGIENKGSKITPQIASEILSIRGVKQVDIAKMYGISQSVVSRIKSKHNWAFSTVGELNRARYAQNRVE